MSVSTVDGKALRSYIAGFQLKWKDPLNAEDGTHHYQTMSVKRKDEADCKPNSFLKEEEDRELHLLTYINISLRQALVIKSGDGERVGDVARAILQEYKENNRDQDDTDLLPIAREILRLSEDKTAWIAGFSLAWKDKELVIQKRDKESSIPTFLAEDEDREYQVLEAIKASYQNNQLVIQSENIEKVGDVARAILKAYESDDSREKTEEYTKKLKSVVNQILEDSKDKPEFDPQLHYFKVNEAVGAPRMTLNRENKSDRDPVLEEGRALSTLEKILDYLKGENKILAIQYSYTPEEVAETILQSYLAKRTWVHRCWDFIRSCFPRLGQSYTDKVKDIAAKIVEYEKAKPDSEKALRELQEIISLFNDIQTTEVVGLNRQRGQLLTPIVKRLEKGEKSVAHDIRLAQAIEELCISNRYNPETGKAAELCWLGKFFSKDQQNENKVYVWKKLGNSKTPKEGAVCDNSARAAHSTSVSAKRGGKGGAAAGGRTSSKPEPDKKPELNKEELLSLLDKPEEFVSLLVKQRYFDSALVLANHFKLEHMKRPIQIQSYAMSGSVSRALRLLVRIKKDLAEYKVQQEDLTRAKFFFQDGLQVESRADQTCINALLKNGNYDPALKYAKHFASKLRERINTARESKEKSLT